MSLLQAVKEVLFSFPVTKQLTEPMHTDLIFILLEESREGTAITGAVSKSKEVLFPTEVINELQREET